MIRMRNKSTFQEQRAQPFQLMVNGFFIAINVIVPKPPRKKHSLY